MRSRLGLTLAVVAVLLVPVKPAHARLPMSACTVQGVAARCATLVVPESRAEPTGRKIGLRIVVLPSRKRPALADAFTYLAGGPGGAATNATYTAASLWGGVRARRDIVLVDQRGTGLSHRLECAPPEAPLATPDEARGYVDACLASLDADPNQYGTTAAMDDLDAVRIALGYRKLDVYGTSYGATAAQVFLARHPGSVRTVVLDGGTLLGIPFYARFAANGERALALLARRCAAERACARAFPGWRSQLDALISRWNAQPVAVSGTAILTGDGLAGVIQQMTLTAADASSIPLAVSRAAAGDYGLLLRYVASGEPSVSFMYWSIWCNEPWVGLQSAGPWGSYLDGYLNGQLAYTRTVCPLIPTRTEPPAAWATPRSRVPLLALVGGADPQDPIGNLAGLAQWLPNSRIVVVPGQGHTVGQYGCLGKLAARFVARGTVKGLDTTCARKVPLPPFVLR